MDSPSDGADDVNLAGSQENNSDDEPATKRDSGVEGGAPGDDDSDNNDDDNFIDKDKDNDDENQNESDDGDGIKHYSGESEDDQDEGTDEDEEDLLANLRGKKRKGSKSGKDNGKKRKKEKRTKFRYFADEADVAEEEEEEEEDDHYRGGEEVLDQDVLAANQKVESRHAANREFLNQSADELANVYRERHKREQRFKSSMGMQDGGEFISRPSMGAVMQQSLLPTITDPKIFMLKCKPGMEMQLVRSLLLKAIENKNRTGLMKIKSAFCSSLGGTVYVEAVNETFAKDGIQGIRSLYQNSFVQIPVQEMTSTLSVHVKKKPLKAGDWVRLKRGVLKGDLARILGIFEGGAKAFIQAVPRPDYSVTQKKKPRKVDGVRPQARMFEKDQLPDEQRSTVYKRHHPLDTSGSIEPFQVWNNEYYRDGFLFKEVTIQSYLNGESVNPKIEELQMFKPAKKARNRDNSDDENGQDSDEEPEEGAASGASFLKELAEQIKTLGEVEVKEEVTPFLVGDLVQVTSGDLRNLVARVVVVDDANRQATIVPFNNTISTEMTVELDLLIKYIFPGAHVKVVAGQFMGQTGRVVSVDKIDSDYVASILTDAINTEIRCNVGQLQMSSEVTTGQGSLAGYELYDLVSLNENESALVIAVGAEKLKVINNLNVVKDVLPLEVQSKQNQQSQRSTGFDSQHNTVKVLDTVNVVAGQFAKSSGTIKHMMKGNFWLHSNTYMKNSGVFVVKSRNTAVAGGGRVVNTSKYVNLAATPTLGSNTGSVGSRTSTPGGAGGFGNRNGRDPALNSTVKIIKGSCKGLLAQVVGTTPTHFTCELLARMRKIVIERDKVEPVGDRDGSFSSLARSTNGAAGGAVPGTPFYAAQTPLYAGNATPMHRESGATPMHYGGDTPKYGNATPVEGGSTPGYGVGENVWKINSLDQAPPTEPLPEEEEEYHRPSTHGSGVSQDWGSNAYSPAESLNQSTSGRSDMYSPADSYRSNRDDRDNSSVAGLNGREDDRRESTLSALSALSAPKQSHAAVEDAAHLEWTVDMVVLLTKGPKTGRPAVITKEADPNGMFQVCLRAGSGKVDRKTPMEVGAEKLKLASCVKKELAVVFTGKNKGDRGIVKAVMGKDVMIDVEGAQAKMFKAVEVAFLNVEK